MEEKHKTMDKEFYELCAQLPLPEPENSSESAATTEANNTPQKASVVVSANSAQNSHTLFQPHNDAKAQTNPNTTSFEPGKSS